MRLLGRDDITAGHLRLLVEMVRIDPFGTQAVDVLKRIALGEVQLWEVKKGIVVTEVIQWPAGQELYINGFAGKTGNIKEVYAGLIEQAKKWNCRWVGGCVGNEKVGKIARRAGSKKIAERFLQEV